MNLYRLLVDGKERFVRSTQDQLRKAMYEHIRTERAKGRSLTEIQFCWGPVTITKL
jgi:hypothetical protein